MEDPESVLGAPATSSTPVGQPPVPVGSGGTWVGSGGGGSRATGGGAWKVCPQREHLIRAPRGPTLSSATRNRVLQAEQATIMPRFLDSRRNRSTATP